MTSADDLLLGDISQTIDEIVLMRGRVVGEAAREYSLAITALEEAGWRLERGMNVANDKPLHCFLPRRAI